MNFRNDFFLIGVVILLSGCSTTIDLYQYKDVSSLNILDEEKANYQIQKPNLNPNITVDEGKWKELGSILKDSFLAENDRQNIFQITEKDAYTLQLKLQNFESFKEYYPAELVKTKDSTYFTDPYWKYSLTSRISAQLVSPKGQRKFFESSDQFYYSVGGTQPVPVREEKKIQSIKNSLDALIPQIANYVVPDGMIISKKVSIKDEDDYIFLVNMGSENGLYPEKVAIVFKEVIQKNEVDATTLSQNIFIGSARVSNQVSPHHAWIVMDDEKKNPFVDIGDVVRIIYY